MNSNSHPASKLEHLLTVNCQPKYLVCVDLTPDGQILVVGETTKIQLWNVSARQPVHKLIKVSGCLSISCVAMSADGKTLACASGRGIIKVWNLYTGRQSLTFRAHRYGVEVLALSHDGQIIASSANDGTLRVWNLKKVREVGFYIPSPAVVNCLALTPNGQTLVYGRFSSLIVWNWKTGKEIELEGHSESITTVAIAADGKTVASGSYDRTIKIWDLDNIEEVYTLTGHSDYIFSVAISADGQTLISRDCEIGIELEQHFKLWDLATRQEIATWKEHLEGDPRRTSVAISADGRILACGCGNTIKVWRVRL